MVAIGARLKKEEGSFFLYDFSFIWNWKAVKTISLFQIVNRLHQHKLSLYVVLRWLLICWYGHPVARAEQMLGEEHFATSWI